MAWGAGYVRLIAVFGNSNGRRSADRATPIPVSKVRHSHAARLQPVVKVAGIFMLVEVGMGRGLLFVGEWGLAGVKVSFAG